MEKICKLIPKCSCVSESEYPIIHEFQLVITLLAFTFAFFKFPSNLKRRRDVMLT